MTDSDVSQSLLDDGTVTGVVVAASRGGNNYLRVVGYDRPPECFDAVPLDANCLFNVGSVTKCITGTLLADVIADGLVSLDVPIQHLLPQYSDPTDTVRQLATHTAGYAFQQMETWPNTPAEMTAYRARVYAAREKQKTPVQEMDYWTTGYFVLMELLQAVLSAPIETIARQRVFGPLQMNRSTFDSQTAHERGRVLPYDANESRRLVELADAPPLGETGLWTNAVELLRFGQSILHAEHFRPETLARIQNDQSLAHHRKSLGFWLKPLAEPIGPFCKEMSPSAFGHPGYTGCCLCIDPETDFCIAITSANPKLQSDFANYSLLASDAWALLS